jgi:hypothetical protein
MLTMEGSQLAPYSNATITIAKYGPAGQALAIQRINLILSVGYDDLNRPGLNSMDV